MTVMLNTISRQVNVGRGVDDNPVPVSGYVGVLEATIGSVDEDCSIVATSPTRLNNNVPYYEKRDGILDFNAIRRSRGYFPVPYHERVRDFARTTYDAIASCELAVADNANGGMRLSGKGLNGWRCWTQRGKYCGKTQDCKQEPDL